MDKQQAIDAVKAADIKNDDVWWDNIERQISNPYARGYITGHISNLDVSFGYDTEDFREKILEILEYDIWEAGAAPATSSRHQENAVTGFGLSTDDLTKLLGECLKPEEIGGAAAIQHDRVKELIRWFRRFVDGGANPKWFRSHAFELAYYIATSAGNRFIDLEAVRKKGWLEGVSLPPAERAFGEKHGFIPPVTSPQAGGSVFIEDMVKALEHVRDYSTGKLGSKYLGCIISDCNAALDKYYKSESDGPMPAGPVWVKATERLPEGDRRVITRWSKENGGPYIDMFSAMGIKSLGNGGYYAPDSIEDVEWLDESGPQIFTRDQVVDIVKDAFLHANKDRLADEGMSVPLLHAKADEYMNTNYPPQTPAKE